MKNLSFALLCLVSLSVWPSAVKAEPIEVARYAAWYGVTFYDEPEISFRKNGPGSLSYDASRVSGDRVGNFLTTVSLTPGKMAMVDVMGRSTGELVHYSSSGGEIRYALRVAAKDPAAPTANVFIPVSLQARGSVKVTAESGSQMAPYASAGCSFRNPAAPTYETLFSIQANHWHRNDSANFDGLRALPVGQTGFLTVSASGWNYWDTRIHRGEWQAIADPIVMIDPAATVIVNGVQRPASEVYTIEMSEGFHAAQGNPFTWVNADGGSFAVPENWRSYDGPAVPGNDADLEFRSLPAGRAFTVTLDGPRAVKGFSVADADVTLDMGGYRLDNLNELLVGDTGPERGLLRLQNGSFVAGGGVRLGLTTGVEGQLEIGAGAALETTLVSLDTGTAPGSATLRLAGGMLRADQMTVAGPRTTFQFDAGELVLDGGYSSFRLGSPIVVGNGTDPAKLIVASGYGLFSDGLTLSPGAALALRGGALYTHDFSTAPGSTVAWTGGEWTCDSPLALGTGAPWGSNLAIETGMRLNANGGLHVGASGRLSVNGGVLASDSFTHDEGAVLEYASGQVQLTSGNILVGAGGFSGPGGADLVALAGANDQVCTWSGSLTVTEGRTLRLAAGFVRASALTVTGTFDYGGEGLDEPGQGVLNLAFNQPQPASLRIGSGSGDAVINGRTVVQVGAKGSITVWGGGLRIDPGYTLCLLETDSVDDRVGAYADSVELAGSLRLDQRDLSTGSLLVQPTGELSGEGNIFGVVQNAGLISPGFSPGQIHIAGDFEQLSTGTLVMQIASLSEHDRLLVDGQATLGGTLEIDFLDGFVPDRTESFTLIGATSVLGRFDRVVVPGGYRVCYADHLVIFMPVPEPSTFFLLGLGGIVLCMGGWRRCAARTFKSQEWTAD